MTLNEVLERIGAVKVERTHLGYRVRMRDGSMLPNGSGSAHETWEALRRVGIRHCRSVG